jgi:hypothetical protein
MSYLAKLKEKIGNANATLAPAKAAEGAFAASAAPCLAIVAQNSVAGLPSELDRLIKVVASFHAFTEADVQEARTIALGDVPAALSCFRDLAKRAGTSTPAADDRVLCADCSNLRRGHCQAAADGLMADTYRGYSPVPEVLRRCQHFKRRTN